MLFSTKPSLANLLDRGSFVCRDLFIFTGTNDTIEPLLSDNGKIIENSPEMFLALEFIPCDFFS